MRSAPSWRGSGLDAVITDTTLIGQGTGFLPLGVRNPITEAELTKLDGIETGATADQTGPEIVTAIDNATRRRHMAGRRHR